MTTSPLIIADYDPAWPQQFETLRSRIAPALGSLAKAIEHVGSTSVPGLAAKPVIDLDVLLRSRGDLRDAIAALAALGYKHRGDLGVPDREAFQSPPGDIQHHLYVCPPDSKEYARHLAFRDSMRSHPEQGRDYALLKRKLVVEFAFDREGYNRAKTSFVEEVLLRVESLGTFREL